VASSCTVCSRPLPGDGSACAHDESDSSAVPTGTAPRTPGGGGRRRSSSSGTRPTAGFAGTARFLPGDVLAERYRIVEPLGRGGMGEVYRADDLKLDQPVALKFLPLDLQDDVGRRERLLSEVRVARQVSHPTLCRVYDVGEADGQLFLSMEYVDGEDLASLQRRIGRLPAEKSLEIARQVCAGLAAAHARGVLHRDLKPENIMLDGQGQVRVTDFGLAALADTVTGDEVRSGTPAYMAPEQLRGHEVTVRSDVYALGLVLYELFTGQRAFKGRTLRELTEQHEQGTPDSPSALVDDMDPAVDTAIMRCLEKEPASRPRSALAVAALLPGGDPLAAALAAGEPPSPELVAAAGATEGLRPRTVLLLVGGVVAGLALAAVLGWPRTLVSRVPFEKAPAALEDRARELLGRLGHTDRPYDAARGFAVDRDYLNEVEATDRSRGRWDGLATGAPPVAQFWYRDSPRPLVSDDLFGQVRWADPPQIGSGMRGVRYDLRGRLVTFFVVPPQVDAPGAGAAAAPDWTPLFAEAGFDPKLFRPVEPLWSPPFFADTRAAWEGFFPERPDIPLRVEAAGYRGRAVYFRQIPAWTRPERTRALGLTPGQRAANLVGIGLIVGMLLAAGFIARRNLRLGRGDARGAARLARYVFGVGLLAWIVAADHVFDVGEVGIVIHGLGTLLVLTAITWIFYLAIEPYVRRHRPHTLISWTRLLTGGFRDPRVGRDVLIGVATGTAMAVLVDLFQLLPAAVGAPPMAPRAFGLDTLMGGREILADLLFAQPNSAVVALGLLVLLMMARLLLRREPVAIGAALLVLCLPESLAMPLPLWLALPLDMLIVLLPTMVLVRAGLLSAIVAFYVSNRLLTYPLTTDFSGPAATPTLFVAALVLGVTLWAAHVALAGRPLFRDGLAER
jgi:predicted Ser/Thr protein kinase